MKRILSLNLILLIFSFTILNAQENNHARTIRIDPNLGNGGAMSQVFSEINFIPLETTNESLFGDITKLEVTENNYIIFDRDTKSILIFDKQGKFKSKINGSKINENKNNDANTEFYGFNLIKNINGHIIQIKIKDNLYNYDLSGKLIEIIKPTDNKLSYDESYDFNDSVKVVTYLKNKGLNNNLSYKYSLMNNEKVISSYFEQDTSKYNRTGYFAVGGPDFIRTDNPSVLHAVKFYDYNVYQITSKGISTAYSIVFPSTNAIPLDFNINPIYLGKKMDYFFLNVDKIFGIGHTYQVGDFLYFKCGSLGAQVRKNGSFVYNLKKDYLISLNRLDPDSLSYHLPIIGRWENDFKKYDGKYLYASLSALEMFNFYEQEKGKKNKYPLLMDLFFSKGSKKDNPVIIQLKPKKAS